MILIKKALFLISLASIFFMGWGCSAHKPTIGMRPEKPVFKAPPANAFYYFTESQIQLKKGNFDKAIECLRIAMTLDPGSMVLKRELAQLYWKKKDENAANAVMDELISTYPDDVENLILYSRIKHSLNYLNEAKSAYEKVLAKDPTQRNIYLLLGSLYTDEGNLAFAIQVYKKLIKEFPDFFAGYYLIGQIYAKERNRIEAEKSFKKALDIEPGLDEARYELIQLYKESDHVDQAQKCINIFKEILNRNPDDIRATMELGYFYYETGMLKEAEKKLTALGTRSKNDKHVIQQIIRHYLDQQLFDKALVVLKYMLNGAPKSSEIHYVMGIAYDGKDNGEMAVHHFRKIDPGSQFFQNAIAHIAFIYQNAGKINEAVEYINKIIDIAPENLEFRLYLGSLYEEIEMFEKAEMVLKQGIAIDPDNAQLIFRLGVIYDKWGKKEDSIQMMKSVIKLDPKDANALNYLGYTYADMGSNLDEAERLITEALKHKPNDGYIIDSLGWVYYKKGVYEKALEFLIQATDLVPDDPIILEHLGDAYLKTDKKQKALETYRRSLMNGNEGKELIDEKIRKLTDEGY